MPRLGFAITLEIQQHSSFVVVTGGTLRGKAHCFEKLSQRGFKIELVSESDSEIQMRFLAISGSSAMIFRNRSRVWFCRLSRLKTIARPVSGFVSSGLIWIALCSAWSASERRASLAKPNPEVYERLRILRIVLGSVAEQLLCVSSCLGGRRAHQGCSGPRNIADLARSRA